MGDLTEAQRDAVDQQIRERILESLPQVPLEQIPLTAIIGARRSLGLSPDLRYDGSYFRDCDKPFPSMCPREAYRNCPAYKGRLVSEFLDGSLDLVAVGLA